VGVDGLVFAGHGRDLLAIESCSTPRLPPTVS
jgi:hypothetical protein